MGVQTERRIAALEREMDRSGKVTLVMGGIAGEVVSNGMDFLSLALS